MLLFSSAPVVANEVYIVVQGDTACEIAEEFSIPCSDLIAANRLGSNGLIFVGQRLDIPKNTTNESESSGLSVVPQPEPLAEPKVVESVAEGETPETSVDVSEPAVISKTGLWSIYAAARGNDAVLEAHKARHEAAKQSVPQARAAMRPQLSFDSNLTRSYDDDFQENDNLRTSLSLNQSLYSPSSSISLRQARYRISAADADYREAEQDLILRTARAYFSALKMADNLSLSEKNQQAIGRQLELALERLKAGLGTRTELFDAEAGYESSVADGIEAAKLLDGANQELILLIDKSPGALRGVRLASPAPPMPNEPEPWIDSALANNNRLVAEKHNLAVLRLEAEKKRASRLPTLGASLTGSFNDTEKTNTTQTTFALRLSIPLLQGGLIRSQIKEADLNLRAAYSSYESSRRQIQIQTRGAFLSISSRLRRIEALAGAVRSSESALRAKEEGLAAGLNTNSEVLDGQRDLFLAEFNYLRERYDYVIEILELEALAGDLTSADVQRVNEWLE